MSSPWRARVSLVLRLAWPWLALMLGVALAITGCQLRPPVTALPRLELVAAYPIESPLPVEPSGLVLKDGQLYSVADSVDHVIFRVDLDPKAQVARFVPFLRFTPPTTPLDLEGIAVDANGDFLLASEAESRVLRVTPAGEVRWEGESVHEAGRRAGLLGLDNAGLEGITRLPNGDLVLAAERQPRGLIYRWQTAPEEPERVYAWADLGSEYGAEMGLLRVADFTGLSYDRGRLFALFRNANAVVELHRSEQARGPVFTLGQAWSYRHIEEDPAHLYQDNRFGKAEGLAVDGDAVYLILDNNFVGRQADSRDRRPWLFVCRFPVGS